MPKGHRFNQVSDEGHICCPISSSWWLQAKIIINSVFWVRKLKPRKEKGVGERFSSQALFLAYCL